MADVPDPDPPDSGPPAVKAVAGPRSRRRRAAVWALKFVAWCGLMFVVVGFIAALVIYIAYLNLTHVVNGALAELVPDWRIEVGEIDIGEKGRIRIDDLVVGSPGEESASPLFSAGAIELDYELDELRTRRKFRAIRVEDPVVFVDDAGLAGLEMNRKSVPDGTTEKRPPALQFLGQFTDSLVVTGGRAEVEIGKHPPLSLGWEISTGPLDFDGNEWLTEDPIDLRLSDLEVGESGEHARVDEITVTLKIGSDLKRIEAGTLRLEEPQIRVTPDSLPPFGGDKDIAASAGTKPIPATEPAAASSLVILLEALEIDRARFELAGGETFPDVDFETSLHWKEIRVEGGELDAGGGDPLVLVLEDIRVGGGDATATAGEPLSQIDSLAIEFLPSSVLGEKRRIEKLEIDRPVIRWNRTSASRFSERVDAALEGIFGAPSPADPDAATSPAKPVAPLEIGSFRLGEADVEIRDLNAGGMPIPHVSLRADIELGNLTAGGPGGFRASGDQAVSFRQIRIERSTPDGEDEPPAIFQADEIAAKADWETVAGKRLIDSVEITKPVFNLTDATLEPWLGRLTDAPDEKSRDPDPTTTEVADPPPPWIVETLDVSGGVFRLDTAAIGGRIPKAQGMFDLANLSRDSGADSASYRAVFRRLRVRSRAEEAATAPAAREEPSELEQPARLGGLFPGEPDRRKPEPGDGRTATGVPEHDVGFIKLLQVDFTAKGIQQEKLVDRILIEDGTVTIGDGLDQLLKKRSEEDAREKEPSEEADSPPADADTEPDPPPLAAIGSDCQDEADEPGEGEEKTEAETAVTGKGWRVGEIAVNRSRALFEGMIPQVAGIEVDIKTTLNNVPLTGGDLLAQDTPQKLELFGIRIRDPYEGFQPVADLPTIFVEFTLKGILDEKNPTIDRITLITPSLYVGEPLFNWIEYQRKYRSTNEGTRLEIGTQPGDKAAPPEDGEVNWTFPEISATGGQIIIAPAGYPMTKVPFPFEAHVSMVDGPVQLNLEIPDHGRPYTYDELELLLVGLKGKIEFNKENPDRAAEERANNLVLTFTLEGGKWKDYEAEDLSLWVTFDNEVVSGEFYGEAYQGKAGGKFNIYLKDKDKWDAVLWGKKVDMARITQVVTPASFSMEGVIDCTLVSEGRGLLFGETWGEIDSVTGGRIQIPNLEEMIAGLPAELSLLQRSSLEVGLDTLGQFEYDDFNGDLYFVDRNGWVGVRFSGPHGSRAINLHSHDWRPRKTKPEPESPAGE